MLRLQKFIVLYKSLQKEDSPGFEALTQQRVAHTTENFIIPNNCHSLTSIDL